MKIHPTAIVSPEAQIASDVEIGPFCVVEPGVTIGGGCVLAAYTSVKTGVTLGEENRLSEGVVLGGKPQHIHSTEPCGGVLIGNGNTIREHVTIHCAMSPDHLTRVGDNNFFMVNAHVAHDCVVGNHVILTNNAMLGGFVLVEDRANISGGVAIHQFCRIGMFAMVGGLSHVVQDVLPFVNVDGGSSLIVGINRVGLVRANVSNEEIHQIRHAYEVVYEESRLRLETIRVLREQFPTGLAAHFADFLEGCTRGYIRDRRASGRALKLIRPDEKSTDSSTSTNSNTETKKEEGNDPDSIRVTG